MSSTLLCFELLEQLPPSPTTIPELPPLPDEPVDAYPDVAPFVEETAGLAGEVVAENKLEHLGHPTVSEIIDKKTNLKQFLDKGNKTEESLDVMIGKLEGIFEKVVSDYCKLSPDESKHMATGIVCSLVDAVTSQLNDPKGAKQPTETKEGEKTEDEQKSDGLFGKLFDVAGNLGEGLGKGGQMGGLQEMFNQLMGAFGGFDVLKDRLKSIWLILELTRRAKAVYCPIGAESKPDASKCKEQLDRDHWIAQDTKLFVGSARVIETAIKANPDVIQPEYMTKKADFLKVLSISASAQPITMQYTLLDLLGLTQPGQSVPGTTPSALAASDYFADIGPEIASNVNNQSIAEKIVGSLSTAVEKGKVWQDNRAGNRTKFGAFKKDIGGLMKDFAPLMGDADDPNSLYTTFKKRVNLIWGFFTGEAFDDVEYDATETNVGATGTDLLADSQAHTAMREGIGKNLVRGSVAYFAADAILSRESAHDYTAINPSDGKQKFPSIGLMQRNGPRCGDILKQIHTKNEKLLIDEKDGLGADFGAYVIAHPDDWRKETQNRSTGPEDWKINRVSLLKRALGTGIAHEVMDAQVAKDTQEYIVAVKAKLGIDKPDDQLSSQEKKAIVMLSRFYNAGSGWTNNFIEKLPADKKLDLVVIRDTALANPWNKEDNLIAGVRKSITETYMYCEAMPE